MKVTKVVLLFLLLVFACFVLPVEGQDSEIAVPLFFSQWADGGGWFITATLVNNGLDATQAAVEFRDGEGKFVAVETDKGSSTSSGPLTVNLPKGVTVVTTRGPGSQIRSGQLIVRSGQPMDGNVQFNYVVRHFDDGTPEKWSTTVEPAILRRGHSILINYSKPAGSILKSTGIALANVNEQPIKVRLVLIDAQENRVAEKEINLAAYGQVPKYVHELFAEFMDRLSSFDGRMEIISDSFTATMSVRFTYRYKGDKPDGYQMDSVKSMDLPFKDRAEMERRTIQAVCVVAADQTMDQNCFPGMSFLAQQVCALWDRQLSIRGQGQLCSSIGFARDSMARVKVVEFRAAHPAAFYRSEPFYTPTLIRELREKFGSKTVFATHSLSGIAFGYTGFAMFGWPRLTVINGWKNVSEAYLLKPDDPPQRPGQQTEYNLVAGLIRTAAHEFGHMIGLDFGGQDGQGHSNLLRDTYQRRLWNLLAFDGTWELELNTAREVMPKLNLYGTPFITVTTERRELWTLLDKHRR